MSANRVETVPFGRLPPRYTFALNPRLFARVNQCPDCHVPTEELILPLLVRVEPDVWIVIRMTCRHCPQCDLLVADRRRLEGAMAAMLMQQDPSVVGHDYQVIGTVQTRTWEAGMRRGAGQQQLDTQAMLRHVHDFVAVRTLASVGQVSKPSPAQPAARKANKKHKRK